MEQKSELKVMKAGFTIIRKDDQPSIRIKFKDNGSQNWTALEKFETKAARDRRFNQLMESAFIIEN